MFDLAGKTAIVTGGSRGIGRATSVALAQAGALVLVNYRSNEEAARETVRLIEETGGRAELVAFDVADPDSVERNIKEAVTRHGRIDILVNNAGISLDQLLLRVSAKDLQMTWATNVNGAVYCAKACIRPMMKNRWGRIINLSSVVAESGNAGQAVYASSKAALLGLTRSLAREYASRGITVNAVAPGFIETDMTADLPEAARQGIVDQTPLGRIGRPEEVAAAVVFLASDEAGYITGQVVRVNGGMHV
ncbi:MAG: 3-oxoacyl-[acyl-carrier-protein] reductase [Deltaproteobacteria bacterium]|nr:3-oxoacyl-[acyl-carrier-protein] reductase [Deltaproteobacteria bacterium]NND30766.1 3-oxoacyl-[acyl-carrier-protein] reductase [Myxococcales bacterium]MBT8463334.1 3-oxoacyl-[acyl-carrier-protein] reductase [Deltaproteobacteria bacterium]MBT8482969.1 3-oxoacyl-[acyl-carrier-protein] reductase [Deltaproteobacteria bacterium]NNK07518.1 3-oxoacyl-[acyl-carrier-protein] reductase [Myxococcales bacterium]